MPISSYQWAIFIKSKITPAYSNLNWGTNFLATVKCYMWIVRDPCLRSLEEEGAGDW